MGERRKEKFGGGHAGRVEQVAAGDRRLRWLSWRRVLRANKPSGLDKMSDGEFEELVIGWLKAAGVDGES